jgi:ElaB/YqjD/DUF883 family membrane-anchored ribosome-binding protein
LIWINAQRRVTRVSDRRDRSPLKNELESLRRQITRSAAPDEPAAAEAEPGVESSQIERLLSDLKTISVEAEEKAEEIVIPHPFASVVAAFFMGLLAGWTMGRSS